MGGTSENSNDPIAGSIGVMDSNLSSKSLIESSKCLNLDCIV